MSKVIIKTLKLQSSMNNERQKLKSNSVKYYRASGKKWEYLIELK